MKWALNHHSTTFHGYLSYMVILLDTLSVGTTDSGGNDTDICINSLNHSTKCHYIIVVVFNQIEETKNKIHLDQSLDKYILPFIETNGVYEGVAYIQIAKKNFISYFCGIALWYNRGPTTVSQFLETVVGPQGTQ